MQFPLSLDLLLFWLGFPFWFSITLWCRLNAYLNTNASKHLLSGNVFSFSLRISFTPGNRKESSATLIKKQSRKKVSKLLGNRLFHSLDIHEIQQRYHSKLKTRKVLWVGAPIQIKFCNGDKMKALWWLRQNLP